MPCLYSLWLLYSTLIIFPPVLLSLFFLESVIQRRFSFGGAFSALSKGLHRYLPPVIPSHWFHLIEKLFALCHACTFAQACMYTRTYAEKAFHARAYTCRYPCMRKRLSGHALMHAHMHACTRKRPSTRMTWHSHAQRAFHVCLRACTHARAKGLQRYLPPVIPSHWFHYRNEENLWGFFTGKPRLLTTGTETLTVTVRTAF